MSGRFAGKVAIVAGSSRGIGRASACHLAREGAKVVLNASGPVEPVLADFRAARHAAVAVRGDVAQPDTAERLVAAALDAWGRIDLLVNNVGIAGPVGPMRDITYEDWSHTLMTNTWAALGLVRAAMARGLGRTAGGAVVNMSSIGSRLELPGLAAYNASKLALESMTRALARELGPAGVRVNAVAPGLIKTEMGKGQAEGPLGEKRARHMPLRRLGEPDDVARAVLFLLSDEAAYITGVVLDVDGGYLTVGPQGD